MRKKIGKKEITNEVVEVKEEVTTNVNPLAIRYITLCKEKGLNALDVDTLTDAQLEALIKHLTR